MILQRLCNQLADGHAGIQGREGILENDLHIFTQLCHFFIRELTDVLSLKIHLTGSRLDQP